MQNRCQKMKINLLSLLLRQAQLFWSKLKKSDNNKPQKIKPLFDNRYVYSCDSVGEHRDLEGKVVYVDPDPIDECVAVDVDTEYGVIQGFTYTDTHLPKVGYTATIRVYNSRGGWYPDDRIVGWIRNE